MLKRGLDLLLAGSGLLLFSPLLCAVGLAVWLYDGGPALYRARRVGQGGEEFDLFKFRTMIPNADMQGPAITASNDARVTPIGRVLRRTKFDELPQLLNVVRGEMSLVGPRPEDPRYVALYSPEQQEILTVKPGITSAASLAYRHEEELLSGAKWEDTYRKHVLPDKIATDLEYIRNNSLGTDLRLIARTIWTIVA